MNNNNDNKSSFPTPRVNKKVETNIIDIHHRYINEKVACSPADPQS